MDKNSKLILALKLNIFTAQCLQQLSIYNINFEVWQQKTYDTLQRLFGYESKKAKEYMNIEYSSKKMQEIQISRNAGNIYLSGLIKAVDLLEDCISVLTGEKRENYNSNMFSCIEDTIKNAAIQPDDKKILIEKLQNIRKINTEGKDNSITKETQYNKLASFLNKITLDNKEEGFYGADLYNASGSN